MGTLSAVMGTFLPGRGDGISQGKRSDKASGQGEGQEGSGSCQLLPLFHRPPGRPAVLDLALAVQNLSEPRSAEPHLC